MITTLKKLLPQGAFARGVSVLVGGTASGQALMILAAPLLTRLYSPEDFGLLAVYVGLLAIFNVVSSLRYELAIPLPEDNTEAVNLLVLSLLIVVLITGIAGLMVFVIGEQIALVLDTPELSHYIWLLPIGVFLAGLYKALNYWAIRVKAFSDIAKTKVTQTVFTLLTQTIGFKVGGIMLLFGQAGGQGVGSVRLFKSALKLKVFRSWTWIGVWQVAKRYKDFPIFSTWSALFNTAGTQLPPLVFAAFFSSGAAGLYALANRIIKLPITILSSAVGQVYFSNLAQAKQNGDLSKQVEKGAVNLLKLSLPAAAVFMLLAPDLFLLVFGEKWGVSGEIARWMTPWIFFQFISSSLSVVYFVLEKQKLGLYFQIGMFTLRFSSLYIGYLYLDFIGALIAFSIISAFSYATYCYTILWLSEASSVRFSFLFLVEMFKVAVGLLPVVFSFLYLDFYQTIMISILMLLVFYIPKLKKLYS